MARVEPNPAIIPAVATVVRKAPPEEDTTDSGEHFKGTIIVMNMLSITV